MRYNVEMSHGKEYTVTVWNVFKNNLPFLGRKLSKLIKDSDVLLLQEYVSSLDKRIPEDYSIETNYTFTIPIKKISSGTATVCISKYPAVTTEKKLSKHRELGITTYKSIIATKYDLHGTEVTFINIHALNFVNTKTYISAFKDWLKLIPEEGPVIFAGDFNTWNSKRFHFVERTMCERGFEYGHYNHNVIFRLDHVWTRGVEVKSIKCDIKNHASDHYPLQIVFSV